HIQMASVYAPVSADQPYELFLNCPEDAFKTAEKTLDARRQEYGVQSTEVRAWVAAQDQVFANCEGKAQNIPPVLESSDPLLRADRNYQTAAALFYSRRFDEAAAAFQAIAKDNRSPWAPYGNYLSARAMVRKAALSTSDDGKPDWALLQAAQHTLEAALAHSE